jgi:hypothetical protein
MAAATDSSSTTYGWPRGVKWPDHVVETERRIAPMAYGGLLTDHRQVVRNRVVSVQVKLAFEGLVDRFDGLTQGLEQGRPGPVRARPA